MLISYLPTKRIVYIDLLKGVGILLLLLSHSFYFPSALSNWIFSFHMPLFFWCTGALICVQYSDSEKLRDHFAQFIVRKCLCIGIPYVVFSLAIILYQLTMSVLSGNCIDTVSITEKLWRILRLQGMESLWFLPCLLIAEIMFAVLHAYLPNFGKEIMSAICVVICVLFNYKSPGGGFGVLPRSCCGFVFMHLGYIMHNTSLLQKAKILPLIACFILGAILSFTNGFAAIGSFELGNPFLFFLSAALTLFALTRLCQIMPYPKLLPWFGQNSIVVLCTNNILIEILRLVDYKLTGNFFLKSGYIGVFLFAVLLTLFEIPIILVGMKYFKLLFGVLPKKERR